MSIQILVTVDGEGQIPQKATIGSSGYDLYAAEELILQFMQRKIVATGISLQIPMGYEGQIRGRSGLAVKSGIMVLNSPGTIDSDYRGEIKVILLNTDQDTFQVTKGMRIAQIVFAKVEDCDLVAVEKLDSTARDQGGFGSTGLR